MLSCMSFVHARAEAVVIEALSAGELTIGNFQGKAPAMHEALVCDAEDDEATPEDFVALIPDGLASYFSNLHAACRKLLAETEAQPRLHKLAEHVRPKNIILRSHPLEVIPCYPTTLDH